MRLGSWDHLGSFARVALIGLVASAVLAIGLAWFIPHRVEQRFLRSMAEADQELVSVLVSSGPSDGLAGLDIEQVDAAVQRLIAERRLVRTKLWSMNGEILYSDESRLVGKVYTPDEDFTTMETLTWHISDLSAEENEFELSLGHDRLLETYVGVQDDGQIVGVWEVYRSLDDFDDAIWSVRQTVWFAVGIGLVSLAIFLVGGFGALLAAIDRKRQEAERRQLDVETLLDLARVSAEPDDGADIAQASMDILIQDDRVVCACLSERSDDGLVHPMVWAGDLTRCAITGAPENTEHDTEAATITAEATSGRYVLQVCQETSGEPLDPTVLGTMIEEIATGLDRARLSRELEANRAHIEFLLEKLVDAQEEERRATVAQIHDGLAQDLHRVLFGIRGCLTADQDETRAELRRLETLISDSSRGLRRLLQNIHPSVVDDVGLAASIHSLVDSMASQYGLTVTVDLTAFREPSYDERIALYRIIREALINVAKHSGASFASVSIVETEGSLEAVVSDTGRGIPDGSSDGVGLWIMRDRAAKLGGTIDLASGESGTTVRISIPKAVTVDAN